MSDCRCSPRARCMSCPSARLELAVELAANNGCCGHVEGDAVCVMKPKDHKGEHKYELADSIVPF